MFYNMDEEKKSIKITSPLLFKWSSPWHTNDLLQFIFLSDHLQFWANITGDLFGIQFTEKDGYNHPSFGPTPKPVKSKGWVVTVFCERETRACIPSQSKSLVIYEPQFSDLSPTQVQILLIVNSTGIMSEKEDTARKQVIYVRDI